jgi:hypothetical protein
MLRVSVLVLAAGAAANATPLEVSHETDPARRKALANGWALIYCYAKSHSAEKRAEYFALLAAHPESVQQEYPDATAYDALSEAARIRLQAVFNSLPPDCKLSGWAPRFSCVEELCGAAACEDTLGSSAMAVVADDLRENHPISGGFTCQRTAEQKLADELARQKRDANYAKARYVEICMPLVLQRRIATAAKKKKPSRSQVAAWDKALAAARAVKSIALDDLRSREITGGFFDGCDNALLNITSPAKDCAYPEVPPEQEVTPASKVTWCNNGLAVGAFDSVREGKR